METPGAWKFDAGVARQFASHAQKHIPDYASVLDGAVALAQSVCAPYDAILEVGCAAGETLRRLHGAGFTNLAGVDSSPDMLGKLGSGLAFCLLQNICVKPPFN